MSQIAEFFSDFDRLTFGTLRDPAAREVANFILDLDRPNSRTPRGQ